MFIIGHQTIGTCNKKIKSMEFFRLWVVSAAGSVSKESAIYITFLTQQMRNVYFPVPIF